MKTISTILAFNARLLQILPCPKKQNNPKANLQFLGQIQVINSADLLPWIRPMFFWMLLNQCFSKLHYKSISTSTHKGRATPRIIFSLHSSNHSYSSPSFTQSQLKNILQLVTNNPLLTKSFNLSINLIPLTQNSPHSPHWCLMHTYSSKS